MNSKMKSRKLKAAVPVDKVAEVKQMKQLVLGKATKKRKELDTETSDENLIATVDHELSSKKKAKKPYHNVLGNERPTGTDSTTPPRGKQTIQVDIRGDKKESKSFTANVTAMRSLTELKDNRASKDTESNRGNSKEAQSAERIPISDDANNFSDELEDEEVDDQTVALKGFESDDESEKDPEDKGYEAGHEIPSIDKKARKQAKAAEKAVAFNNPGVIYIGRIPHGFYEQEMRQYFSQFGKISRLRLSRNRRTGKSKHYAFVEFKSADVAEIVSKTMDNYLLFGHILKCKMVAPEQVHENLWTGANKRFKKVPWNKMEGRRLKQGLTEAGWAKRVEREKIRRAEKQAAMKMMDYSFVIPDLKSAKEVVGVSQQPLITTTEGPNTEELRTIEAADVENTVGARGSAEPQKKRKEK